MKQPRTSDPSYPLSEWLKTASDFGVGSSKDEWIQESDLFATLGWYSEEYHRLASLAEAGVKGEITFNHATRQIVPVEDKVKTALKSYNRATLGIVREAREAYIRAQMFRRRIASDLLLSETTAQINPYFAAGYKSALKTPHLTLSRYRLLPFFVQPIWFSFVNLVSKHYPGKKTYKLMNKLMRISLTIASYVKPDRSLKPILEQTRIANRLSRRFDEFERIIWTLKVIGPFTGIFLGLMVALFVSIIENTAGFSGIMILLGAFISFTLSQVIDWILIKPLVWRLNWEWYRKCYHGIVQAGAFAETWLKYESTHPKDIELKKLWPEQDI